MALAGAGGGAGPGPALRRRDETGAVSVRAGAGGNPRVTASRGTAGPLPQRPGRVPQQAGGVVAGRDERAAVRREGQAGDGVVVPPPATPLAACRRVPQADGPVE